MDKDPFSWTVTDHATWHNMSQAMLRDMYMSQAMLHDISHGARYDYARIEQIILEFF